MERPPNLLLITSDQQHWRTLGALNPKIRTPGLDRLASMGVNFTRAYCPNPTCTPTRASIITGRWPSAHGAYTLGTGLPPEVPTLGEYLSPAGYRSTLIGKAHFQPLKSTPEFPSVESYPVLRDLEFWRGFNARHTPWYGFDHVETARMHTDEGHVGQHYALWMQQQGFTQWREYFQPRQDKILDTPRDGALAPPIRPGPGNGWRSDMHWKLPQEYHYTTWTGQRTIAEIERAAIAAQPFFLWSSYHDPHPPYCVPEPWASMYDPDDMGSEIGHFTPGEFDRMPPPHRMTRDRDAHWAPFNEDGFGSHGYHPHWIEEGPVTEQHLREATAVYYGMISFMDHWIDRTLDALERTGQLDNTLVVFTSDHGHFLGQHGLIAKGPFHYEDVIRVPFIAAMPGRLPAGRTSSQLQTLVDLAPTFLEVRGQGTPRSMQGVSQLENWADPARPGREGVIIENHHNGSQVHLRTLVTDRFKLTVYRGRPWGELFDLQEDPGELHNRFDDPGFREVREMMFRQMVDQDLQREPSPTQRVFGA